MRAVDDGRPLGEILTPRQKWLLLASLMLTMFIGALDQMVVSTATPKILADLGGFNMLSWLFTSYMLTSTIVVPLTGKMSDIYGRRTFVLTGIIAFLISSVACGLAPNMGSLIAFRALQGFGGGVIFASVFACIGDIFPPAERSKFMGLFTGVFSLASILGPLIGGTLTDNLSWRWVFFINIPVCMIALPAIWWNLPTRKGVVRPKIDWVGSLLLSAAAIALLLGFEWAGREYAWTSPQIIGLMAAALLTIVAFVYQESRHPEPVLPLFLFRNNVFLVSNLIVFVMGIGMFGALQYLGLFIQTAQRGSATISGVIGMPQAFGLLFASIIGGQVISRTGRYRWQTVLGTTVVLGAMLFLRRLDLETPKLQISAIMVVLGIGFGMSMPTLSLSVQNAVPYKYLGVASSSSQFFRQIGSVFGIALFAVVLNNSFNASFHDMLTPEDEARLTPPIVAALEDPTIALNPHAFAAIEQSVRAQEGGEALLAKAVAAQRESVASAVRDIFTGATITAAIGIVLCLLLKEVPLRRDFKHATDEVAGSPAGAAPPAGDGPLGEPAAGGQ
jgi:EmrB/QacA subfamily drug resistance transporter